MLRLQQQQMLLRSKLDRVYEDRLKDAIPEELWNTKSAELQEELRRLRAEMERHEVASEAYETAGLQILELAQLEIGSVHWTIFDPGSSAGQRDMKAGGVYSACSAIIGSTRAARCAGRSDASSVTATSTPATTA